MTLSIDIWSDLACPWCYVGKRRVEAALARFSHRDEVELRWHAFELDPSAPKLHDASRSYSERLAAKYRLPVGRAEAMIEQMTRVAQADGIEMHFERVRAGSTFDAHRLLQLAAERGVQHALGEQLFRAYFTDGVALGDPEALVPLATQVGLPEAEVRAVLAGDRYAAEVRADEQLASELGITGVPFFVLGGRLGVSGAQPADVLLAALERAWSERADAPRAADAPACGPDGCA